MKKYAVVMGWVSLCLLLGRVAAAASDTQLAFIMPTPAAQAARGKFSTPTMLMTGEVDYRTPSSEAEPFYEALKLCKVDTALVRVPGASHDISARPSHLIAKVQYILGWFQQHDVVGVAKK